MHITSFRKLLARVERDLSPEQHIDLRRHLDAVESGRETDLALGARTRAVTEGHTCPRCGASGATKHGRDQRGRQRFRGPAPTAGGCGRTFNALTSTPFARMCKPERWHAFAKALSGGLISVNALDKMGLGVSRLTIWRWRNRFLDAQARRQAEKLGRVVEVDETYFKTSFKGSRGWVRGNPPENRPPRYRGEPAIKRGLSNEQIAVLAAVDSSGNIFEAKISGLPEIRPTLKDRIEPGSIICSDGVRTYVHLAMDTSSEHRRIRTPIRKSKAQKLKGGKPRQKGRLALGRVNAHHERMETFVNRVAPGASTANLATYLGWQRTVGRAGFKPEDLLIDALAYPPTQK